MNDVLQQILSELGLSEAKAPCDKQQWQAFLNVINEILTVFENNPSESFRHAEAPSSGLTERKNPDDLSCLQEKYQAIFDNGAVGIALLNENHELSESNQVLNGIFDTKARNVNQVYRIYDFFDEKNTVHVRSFLDRLVHNSSLGNQGIDVQTRVKTRKDAINTWIHLAAKPVGSHQNLSFILIVQDITERMVAISEKESCQTAQRQAEKMASLGEISGNIAHEINNPLGVISGRVQKLSTRLETGALKPNEAKADMKKITDTVRHITKIIKGLKTFSRNAESDPFTQTKLIEVLTDTMAISEDKLKKFNTRLIIDKSARDKLIFCRPAQIVQVLVNFLNNAVDAISDLDQRWIKVASKIEGNYVLLTITDSGPGISREIGEKIFSPFFSTKKAGKGTGLGLSISNSIIMAHKGKLWIDYEQPNTTFVISLPRIDPAKLPASDGKAA